jgi:hypothetical protein
MSDGAYRGYHNLLMSQWQSEDGTLPTGEKELARLSGLFARWAEFREEILEHFRRRDGRLVNLVQHAEWEKARQVSERKGRHAPQSGQTVDTEGIHTVASIRTHARARTITTTGTETNTTTKTEKQKPSRAVRASGETKHSSDPRHVACKAEIATYFRGKNNCEPDWDGREGKALGMLLGANPNLTAEGIRRLLEHRARSEVNHAERPGMWLATLGSYRAGPLDRFGKPIGMANGKTEPGVERYAENPEIDKAREEWFREHRPDLVKPIGGE